jgi:hypothetical protein
MAKYLLIESRDPFESNDVGYYYELAMGLEGGNEVTLFPGSKRGLAGAPVEALSRIWRVGAEPCHGARR